MNKRQIRPTEAELEILQVLWEEGPSSVRQVNQLLNEKRDIGYTTTLKLMQIMLDKGLVRRTTDTRSHIYSAQVKESDTQSELLNKFLESAYRGSASKLVLQVLGNHKASQEELKEIKALIDKLENQNQ